MTEDSKLSSRAEEMIFEDDWDQDFSMEPSMNQTLNFSTMKLLDVGIMSNKDMIDIGDEMNQVLKPSSLDQAKVLITSLC